MKMGAAEQLKEVAEKRSLVRKLAEVTATVDRVAKSGRNDFHKYDYATEADIAAAVRHGMAERHLALFPDTEDAKFEDIGTKNGTQRMCTAKVRFTVEDGESGETRSFVVYGQGQDAGDKAFYKALTGAEKYALLKLFMIPTGDDPEAESPPAKEQAEKGQLAPQGASRAQAVAQQLKARDAAPTEAAPVVSLRPPSAETEAPERSRNTEVPFGKNKGRHLCDIDFKDLDWLATKARADVARNDERWHEKNERWLKAIQDEIARRA
jgi:hypothetical protein